MGSNEPYINVSVLELDYYNQAKIISLDVENIVLVSYTVHRIECRSDVGEVHLMAFAGFSVPLFQCFFCIRVFGVEIDQCFSLQLYS